jgi:hypothetical protein
MQLDGDELPVHINITDPGFSDQLLELGGQSVSKSHRAEIGKIDLCFLHVHSPLLPDVLIAQDVAAHPMNRPQDRPHSSCERALFRVIFSKSKRGMCQ